MTTFQIVQMDAAAAKWLGFAKQQCKRIMDNGTKDFYREWTLEGSTVKVKAYGGTAKIWLVSGGVTDFVGVAMPNPVPYRGVSIGVVDRGIKHPRSEFQSGSYHVSQYTVNMPVYGGYQACSASLYSTANGVQTLVSTTVFSGGTGANDQFYPYAVNAPVGAVAGDYAEWPGVVEYTYASSGGNFNSGYTVWDGVSLAAAITAEGDAQYEAQLAKDIAADQAGAKTYVMTSDGTVLASEVQNTTSGGQISFVPDLSWNGDTFVNMFHAQYVGAVDAYDHRLNFAVPEDCIYPSPVGLPYYSSVGSWSSGLAERTAGVAVFNARRKAWLLKNSNEFIAALKGKFAPGTAGVTRPELQTGMLPASWDYQIKLQISAEYSDWWLADGSHPGRHTKMPIVMSITFTDTVQSDTSAGLTQAGTMVTQRSATFQYVDAARVNQTTVVNGTLTQVVTQHTLDGAESGVSLQNTFTKWYDVATPAAWGTPTMQFMRDRYGEGLGQLWNGVEQTGLFATSEFNSPSDPLIYAGLTPPWPSYSSTLAGVAAPLYLQYHNTVLPQYVADTNQSSTTMNNSAMYHVKQVKLRLFGPAPSDPNTGQPAAIGIFPDPTDADGATHIAYYGEASLLFDWTTGSLTVKGWNPCKDVAGDDAPTIIPLPKGEAYINVDGSLEFEMDGVPAYNCAVGYGWGSAGQMWPDVAEYWKAKTEAMKAGTTQQVLYTVILGKQPPLPP